MIRSFDQLLCAERIGGRLGERDSAERGNFDADGDKLAFSVSVRSLAHKTQVFDQVLEAGKSRNRLTHTLEVSHIARSLGVAVGARLIAFHGLKGARSQFAFWRVDPYEIGAVCAAGGLAHDIGLPPLGHVGEEVIGTFFKENCCRHLIDTTETDYADLEAFEGNANNLRLLCRVDGWRGERGGLNLTAATLATMKYPFRRRAEGKRKYGVFAEDVPLLEWIADRTGMQPDPLGGYRRHPLAYVVEAADDIAWVAADAEDAANLAALPMDEAEDLLSRLLSPGDRDDSVRMEPGPRRLAFMRSRSIRRLVDAVVEVYPDVAEAMEDGSLDPAQDLLDRGRLGAEVRQIKRVSRERIYRSERVAQVREVRSQSMRRALEKIMEAVESEKQRPGSGAAVLDGMIGWRMGSAAGCQVRRALDGLTLLGDRDVVELGQ